MSTTLNNQTTSSQADKILSYLQQGHKLTPLEALEKFGTLRLGARIWDIKNKKNIAVQVQMVEIKPGTRVAQYFI